MLTHPKPRLDHPSQYEQPESPRCPFCDEQMVERRVRFAANVWECENPDCEAASVLDGEKE